MAVRWDGDFRPNPVTLPKLLNGKKVLIVMKNPGFRRASFFSWQSFIARTKTRLLV